MKLVVKGTKFDLNATEVAALKAQLEKKESHFIALNSAGNVIGEGQIKSVISSGKEFPNGVNIMLTSDTEDSGGWWYYGSDHYTIVTEDQFDALCAAGLARRRGE